ncbi:TIGR03915 family putative DNA repair protein [uncultured Eudoraea sp.]|uniref:TIGR03915 family putative DNA repair protein n=1 Tax=uncultured Eudoraea sp. TaxID=1035614 RepID=UPI002601749F|nr:TIGR03915 family putative DNA repair protein [uncultured Eudoraea sp.]
MEKEKILVYDGSFNGFLTSVFMAFEQKINVINIQRKDEVQKGLFNDTQTILTQVPKAKRVWNGISQRSNLVMKNIYFAFLSETAGIEQLLYSYIEKIVAKGSNNHLDLTDDMAFKINHLANMVSKKKSQMEAFMKFNVSIDGVHYSIAEPSYNLLPLVSKHFRSNFGDRQWIIYDIKRNYGLYYDLHTIQLITLDSKEIYANKESLNGSFQTKPIEAIALWDTYFAKNSMKSLISNKLHTHQFSKPRRKYQKDLEAV